MIFIPMRDGEPVSRNDVRIINGTITSTKYVDCVEPVKVGDCIKHNKVRLGLRQVTKFVENYDVYNKDRLKYVPCKKTSVGLFTTPEFRTGEELDYLDAIYEKLIKEDRTSNIELCEVLIKELENCLEGEKYDVITTVLMVHCVVHKTYTEGELLIDKLSTRQRNTLLNAMKALYNRVDSCIMDYLRTDKCFDSVDFNKEVRRACDLLIKLRNIERGDVPC